MTSIPRSESASGREPVWDEMRAETIAHLRELIRIDTVNPPGNELVAARYLERVLRGEGIETHVLEPAPGRAAVVARLRGRGAGRPVLLLAHMDVVGVEREHWSVDPFGGEIRDGYLYGRGAIDDKGMLAVNLECMLLLKRHLIDGGVTLARDVILVATSDEEASGTYGIEWLVRHHPELLDAEYAINEGGRIRIVGGRPLYAAVQTAEKVPHIVSLTAHGPSGHASVPLPGNAVSRLGRALAALVRHREPVHLVETTRLFFRELGAVWPVKRVGSAMRDLASGEPEREARGARALARIPIFDAVLRNGISPTLLRAGIKANVIPSDATATLNVRTLPGESIDDVVARLRQAIRDPNVEVAIVERGADAPASDPGSPMFRAIAESVRALEPALTVVPYLGTGATDSAMLRRIGVQAYGILPFPLTPEDEERMHGHDERVPLASLHFGTRLIHGALVRLVG